MIDATRYVQRKGKRRTECRLWCGGPAVISAKQGGESLLLCRSHGAMLLGEARALALLAAPRVEHAKAVLA